MTTPDKGKQKPPPPPPLEDPDEANADPKGGTKTPDTKSKSSPAGVIDNNALAQILLTMQVQGSAIESLLQAAGKRSVPQFVKPRVGGIDTTGVWTGQGSKGDCDVPRSDWCYRDSFSSCPIKASDFMSKKREYIKGGLPKSGSPLLFSSPEEPNSDQFVAVLRALEELVTETGQDGIYTITFKDETTINMFQEPGLVSPEILDKWIDDLTNKGAYGQDPTSGNWVRLPVCDFDNKCLAISEGQILNSCTEGLKQRIRDALATGTGNGPRALYEVFRKCYNPSQSRVEELKNQLKVMHITKYPEQNVSLWSVDVLKIITEIQLNFIRKDQEPDLTVVALTGLTKCDDPLIRHSARMIRLQANTGKWAGIQSLIKPDKHLTDIRDIIADMEGYYRVLKDTNDYDPASGPSANLAAMEAKVQQQEKQILALQAQVQVQGQGQLHQDRTASSSRGNSNANSGGTSGGTKVCRDCSQEGHYSGDPNCPKWNPKHGLTKEEALHVIAKQKEMYSSMPPRVNVPDDAKYCITFNGKELAKYCRHCGRFVKGTGAHYTSDHKGSRRTAYQSPAAAPAPAATTKQHSQQRWLISC